MYVITPKYRKGHMGAIEPTTRRIVPYGQDITVEQLTPETEKLFDVVRQATLLKPLRGRRDDG